MPFGLVIGMVSTAVALGMLTPWALLGYGVAVFAVSAWELKP